MPGLAAVAGRGRDHHQDGGEDAGEDQEQAGRDGARAGRTGRSCRSAAGSAPRRNRTASSSGTWSRRRRRLVGRRRRRPRRSSRRSSSSSVVSVVSWSSSLRSWSSWSSSWSSWSSSSSSRRVSVLAQCETSEPAARRRAVVRWLGVGTGDSLQAPRLLLAGAVDCPGGDRVAGLDVRSPVPAARHVLAVVLGARLVLEPRRPGNARSGEGRAGEGERQRPDDQQRPSSAPIRCLFMVPCLSLSAVLRSAFLVADVRACL